MLEGLLAGGSKGDDFATVAVRLPKIMHSELSALATVHGLTLQAIGKAALDAALTELRAVPVVPEPAPVVPEPAPVVSEPAKPAKRAK